MSALDDLIKALSLKEASSFNSHNDRVMYGIQGLRIPSLISLADSKERGSTLFLSGRPKVQEIPLVFYGLKQYASVMMRNTEAEYYESVMSGLSIANAQSDCWLHFSRSNDYRILLRGLNLDQESWTHHIVQFQNSNELVFVRFCDQTSGEMELNSNIFPSDGMIRSLGYFGSYTLQYSRIMGLCPSELLRMILDPSQCDAIRVPGAYKRVTKETLEMGETRINESQINAILGLKGGLDVIHGPPGTGKSTTIRHIINSLVRSGKQFQVMEDGQCLITCSRNQAVESILEKVRDFGVLVFGNDDRLGPIGKLNTLSGRLKRDPEVVFWDRVTSNISQYIRSIDKIETAVWTRKRLDFPGLALLEKMGKKTIKGSNGAQLWFDAFRKILPEISMKLRLKKRYNQLKKWKGALDSFREKAHAISSAVLIQQRIYILKTCRIYLCTVDSTPRMARSLEEHEVSLTIDTCIVDEAGCVLESSIPILLRFQPNNLILIGDHKQLQPFSSVRSDPHKTTHHTRSLLERAIAAGLNPQRLTTQYRMHPKICELVSKLFYKDQLLTGQITRENKSPCIWFDAPFQEIEHKKRGYSNPEEAVKVGEVIQHLIKTCSQARIFVITFYNKQRLEISKILENNLDLKERLATEQISVLSVDKCQGSEADYVILSTVRSDGVNAFLLDKRRVCVALSRAKEGILIVGNHRNFQNRGGTLWKDICAHFMKQDQ